MITLFKSRNSWTSDEASMNIIEWGKPRPISKNELVIRPSGGYYSIEMSRFDMFCIGLKCIKAALGCVEK